MFLNNIFIVNLSGWTGVFCFVCLRLVYPLFVYVEWCPTLVVLLFCLSSSCVFSDCLCRVMPNTCCVVFLLCLSSSCVPSVCLCRVVPNTCCVVLCFCFVCLRLVYPLFVYVEWCSTLIVVLCFCLSSSCVPSVCLCRVIAQPLLCCVFVLFVLVLCTLCLLM